MVVIIYCCIGGEDKATTGYLNGFPDGRNLGGQQYNVAEKPTVILYTSYIHRHAEPPNITKHNNNSAIEPYCCKYIWFGLRIETRTERTLMLMQISST